MFYQSLPIWPSALHIQFTNDYQWFANLSLPIIALVISSPLVANVLAIINLPMTLGNLPIAADGLPLVLIGNDIWACGDGGWGVLLNRQSPLSMTKVICWQSLSINRHKNFWNPHKILIEVDLASSILLQIFGIRFLKLLTWKMCALKLNPDIKNPSHKSKPILTNV